MKDKVILFMWFGSEKPPYIQWTLENFRKMNPGWEIRYIKYSSEQLKNYKDQNDEILVKANEKAEYRHINYLADEYRKEYLSEHKDELVVYCDLDCFPIAPFDNFILPENSDEPDWMKSLHPDEHRPPKWIGCNSFTGRKICEWTDDMWCMVNNRRFINWHWIQLHKGSALDENFTVHKGIFMNKNALPAYNERSKAFHEMKIELGDNFCLPQFTPIEHYYSFERNRLNLNSVSPN